MAQHPGAKYLDDIGTGLSTIDYVPPKAAARTSILKTRRIGSGMHSVAFIIPSWKLNKLLTQHQVAATLTSL